MNLSPTELLRSGQTFFENYGWYLVFIVILIHFVFPSVLPNIRRALTKKRQSNTVTTARRTPLSRNTEGTTVNSDNVSTIPPRNDDRLNDIRAKQQERLNRLVEITQETQSNPITKSESNDNNDVSDIMNDIYSIDDNNDDNKDDKDDKFDDSDIKSDKSSMKPKKKKTISKSEKKKKEEAFKKTAAYRYATTGSYSSGRTRPGSNRKDDSSSSYRPSVSDRYPRRRGGG